jgi:hypothetical protein
MLYLAARGISSAQNASQLRENRNPARKMWISCMKKVRQQTYRKAPETIPAIRMFSWQFLQEFQSCVESQDLSNINPSLDPELLL